MTNTTLVLSNLNVSLVEEHPAQFYKGHYRVTFKKDSSQAVNDHELIFRLDKDEFKKSMMEIGHSEGSLTDFPNRKAFEITLQEHPTEILSKIFEVSGKPTDYREISKILSRNDYFTFKSADDYGLF